MHKGIEGLILGPMIILAIGGLLGVAGYNVEADPGYYYPGYSEYKSWGCAGVSGSVLVTNPAPVSGSGDAHCMLIGFSNFDFFAIGWVEGQTPWGSTGTAQRFYWDAVCWGIYQGALLTTATVNTWHTFKLNYILGSLNTWTCYLDGVAKKTLQFTNRVGVPVSQFEVHDNEDVISGHVKTLQYALASGRIIRWYAWDGYGVTDSDPPYQMTIISNTEWTCAGP